MSIARSEALKAAIVRAGGISALSRIVGKRPQAVSQWSDVPVQHLGTVSAKLGIPRRDIRPDLVAQLEEMLRERPAADEAA